MTPGATTRVVAVIGDPVGHSLSPVLHNAAFQAVGLDWVYVAFAVDAGQAAAAVAAVRTLGIAGLSVTMPHKSDVAAALDDLTPLAARLGAVNTVIRRNGALVGDSTDGPGLVDALRLDEGFDPAGRTCLVLGTGGAARAVCAALADAGASTVTVVGRRYDAVEACVRLAGRVGQVGTPADVGDAELVVNATPLGMAAPGAPAALHPGAPAALHPGAPAALPLGVDAADLGSGQLVVDLVYAPAMTGLLVVAAERGARAVNGLGMLVHQAGRQFEAWTGTAAPLGSMAEAARAATASREPRAR